jgi:serine/threonine protein kinase
MSDLEQSTFTWKSASSPEKDIDVDSSYILEAEDSPLSSPVPQSVEDDLLAAETILSDERLEEDDDDEELPPHPVHLKGSKRFSDVMGQSMYHGIDGEHSFFNLKVIFEPRKTGMQEARDFEGTPGTVVAGRYQVMDNMASGAFASAYQCVDAETADVQGNPSWVCLKVIKNNKEYFDQSLDEIKLLQYINSRGSPDEKHFLRLIDFFYYREHLFIVSELLRENLFDFDRDLRLSGAPTYYTLPRLKKISAQMLEALAFIHSLKLIHCDIKPENIVIKSYSRCEVKLIDFGSSCYDTDVKASYIQSRSYRAPEVVLGNDYDHRIDLWSLGGVLAELHTGYVLFQNDSLATMLARITGILGEFPPYVLLEGRETPSYYTASGTLFEMGPESEQPSYSLVHPKTTSLAARLHLAEVVRAGGRDEALFVDFLTQMLDLDWRRRPTASRALLHPWLEDAYHNDVYYEAV